MFQVSLLLNVRVRVFTLSSFFYLLTFLPKHGKFRFPKWNCSYRASKSRRKMNMGGWKRIGRCPLTFNLPAPSRYYRLYLTSKDWMVTIWLTSKKNSKSWNVFDNAGPESAVMVIMLFRFFNKFIFSEEKNTLYARRPNCSYSWVFTVLKWTLPCQKKLSFEHKENKSSRHPYSTK